MEKLKYFITYTYKNPRPINKPESREYGNIILEVSEDEREKQIEEMKSVLLRTFKHPCTILNIFSLEGDEE
jgi:hypothetical protein